MIISQQPLNVSPLLAHKGSSNQLHDYLNQKDLNKMTNEQRNKYSQQRYLHLWVIIGAVNTIDHHTREMIANKMVKHQAKAKLKQLLKSLNNWKRTGLAAATAENKDELEDASFDGVGIVAEIMPMLFMLPSSYVDWFMDAITILIRSAIVNNSKNKAIGEINTRDIARLFASSSDLSEEGKEWLASEAEKLVFRAKNKFPEQ